MRKQNQSTKKYAKISQNRRNRLIQLVFQQNNSVPRASKLLKLKVSTAKNIIKIFKKEGRIMLKQMSGKSNKISRKTCKESAKSPVQSDHQSSNGQSPLLKKQGDMCEISSVESSPTCYFPQGFYFPMYLFQFPFQMGQI